MENAPQLQQSASHSQSVHAAHISEVHMVPLSVIVRPIPPVLDDVKVQSLMQTIREVCCETKHHHLCLNGHFPCGPGSAGSLSVSFLFLIRKRTFRVKGFLQAGCPSCHPADSVRITTKHLIQPVALPYHVFIHHQTPNGRGVAFFSSDLQHQYQWTEHNCCKKTCHFCPQCEGNKWLPA